MDGRALAHVPQPARLVGKVSTVTEEMPTHMQTWEMQHTSEFCVVFLPQAAEAVPTLLPRESQDVARTQTWVHPFSQLRLFWCQAIFGIYQVSVRGVGERKALELCF